MSKDYECESCGDEMGYSDIITDPVHPLSYCPFCGDTDSVVPIEKPEPKGCPACAGFGRVEFTCPTCDGIGCEDCYDGGIRDGQCDNCYGTGEVQS